MSTEAKFLDRIRQALRSEPRIRDTGMPIHLVVSDGAPMIEGEMDHIAGKKLALKAAARIPGTTGIVDRLRVRPAVPMGSIKIRGEDGVVTLDGDATRLGEKRLAGVLAWWGPGSRDAINGLGVTPPETDSEAAVTDAVRQVLEKDPFVNSESITVTTRRGVVRLDGTVPRAEERNLAKDDVWYVFGMDGVVNRLEVRP